MQIGPSSAIKFKGDPRAIALADLSTERLDQRLDVAELDVAERRHCEQTFQRPTVLAAQHTLNDIIL